MLEEDWLPGASLPWGPPPSFLRGWGLRRSASGTSLVTLQATVPASGSESWRRPGTRGAVFTKAVGRDLWAPHTSAPGYHAAI